MLPLGCIGISTSIALVILSEVTTDFRYIFLFIEGRVYYPDEDQGAGVSHFVLPFWHLGHGELTGAGAAAQDLTHLQTKTTTANISVYTYSSLVEDMDYTMTNGSVRAFPVPCSLIVYYIFLWWELYVTDTVISHISVTDGPAASGGMCKYTNECPVCEPGRGGGLSR